jgi:two-component system, sensor histidine kinase
VTSNVASSHLTRPILVVDDVPANLLAVEVALEPLQRQVITATSGEQALHCLLDEDFALVLLDVQMPGMDGYETARWIRSRERSKHLPIIFLTAYDHDDASVLRAYELGAVDFIFKPIVPEVLRAKSSVFVMLQHNAEQLARERLEREFEKREHALQVEAHKELARLNAALAESDRRKDAFIAILAHELRNPLAPIRTSIDLLRDGAPITPHMLGALDRQAGMLSRLIDDLLNLARIKANKIELRAERLELVDVIEGAIESCMSLIEQRQHALVFDSSAQPIELVADSVRLAQVISNLVNNAARYTPPGGRIEVAYGATDDRVFVRVSDNGIGIPVELQVSVFDMFVQERVAQDGSGGLGLGLALAHRLVGLHGGTLTVHSAGRDHGSTFEIQLPRGDVARAAPPPRDVPRITSPSDERVRTIVVDDNDDARDLLAALLQARGFDVLTAADGPSGFELIRDHSPHVALVDLGLPGMDGFGVAEALRGQCPHLKTRLIALTGHGAEEDRERTLRAGFDAHLVKPATAATIIAAITTQLERR